MPQTHRTVIADKLANALKKSLRTSPNPFMTYQEFGRAFDFSYKYPPAWANKNTLDPAAVLLLNDPQIGLDLTYLIRSQTTGYPSVIDGKPYQSHDVTQQRRAQDVADQIIRKFGLQVTNPYVEASSRQSKQKGNTNPPWNRDELILALELYLRNPASPPAKSSVEVEGLSSVLNELGQRLGSTANDKFRNANGVYMKMMNFRRFDPA